MRMGTETDILGIIIVGILGLFRSVRSKLKFRTNEGKSAELQEEGQTGRDGAAGRDAIPPLPGASFHIYKYLSSYLEPEISAVILLDQAEIFQHHISYLFVRYIEDFLFDQAVADGLCLGRSVIHQIFFQGHQCVGMAAVLDLAALAQGHKPVAGAAFPIACCTETGNIVHLHQPFYDLIQSAVVADVKLF